MTRDEIFSKLNKEAEVLLENGFNLIESYKDEDEKLSAEVYEKKVNSKRFILIVMCRGRFVSVISDVCLNLYAWENKITCQLNNYEDVEDDIKELLNSTIELSTL